MSNRAFRSSAIAVTYIARQFGVQINVDAVADAVERSGLSTPKQFADYFYDFGVNVKLRKFKPIELVEKKYIVYGTSRNPGKYSSIVNFPLLNLEITNKKSIILNLFGAREF